MLPDTSMRDLPDELLEEIFGYFDYTQHVVSRRTCRRWRELLRYAEYRRVVIFRCPEKRPTHMLAYMRNLLKTVQAANPSIQLLIFDGQQNVSTRQLSLTWWPSSQLRQTQLGHFDRESHNHFITILRLVWTQLESAQRPCLKFVNMFLSGRDDIFAFFSHRRVTVAFHNCWLSLNGVNTLFDHAVFGELCEFSKLDQARFHTHMRGECTIAFPDSFNMDEDQEVCSVYLDKLVEDNAPVLTAAEKERLILEIPVTQHGAKTTLALLNCLWSR